jgi:hypothetical protein
VKRSIFLFIGLSLLLLNGCTRTDNEPISLKPVPFGSLTVSSMDLYDQGADRFKPFMGAYAGAVKLRYHGELPAQIREEVEIWENGMLIRTLGSFGSSINPSGKDPRESQLIYSLQTFTPKDNMEEAQLTSALIEPGSGSSSSKMTIEKPALLKSTGSSPFSGSLNIKQGEAVYVGVVLATDQNGLSIEADMSKAVHNARWAMAIKVSWSDGDPRLNDSLSSGSTR